MDIRVDHSTQAYWEGAKGRRLLLTRCQDCRTWFHPPRPMCPQCWSENVKVEEPSGDGRVWSWVASSGAIRGKPGITAWVDLAEQDGLRMVADLVDCAPEDVSFDMPVRLAWAESEGVTYPVFAPAGATR